MLLTAHALLLLLACGKNSLQQTCLPVTTHDGAGQVRLEHEKGTLVIALETGAHDLKLFDHGAPWAEEHWSGQERSYDLWGGEKRHLRRLERLRFGGLLDAYVLHPWRQVEAPVHEIESAWGGLVDAWGGHGFFFSLGDQVHFEQDELCVVRRKACTQAAAGKPLLMAQGADRTAMTLLVDSALVQSRVWGKGEQPITLTLDQTGTPLRAWPYPERSRYDRPGTGKLGETELHGLVGWADLSQMSWTWDLCTQEFTLHSAPNELPPAPKRSAWEMHMSNSHRPS